MRNKHKSAKEDTSSEPGLKPSSGKGPILILGLGGLGSPMSRAEILRSAGPLEDRMIIFDADESCSDTEEPQEGDEETDET